MQTSWRFVAGDSNLSLGPPLAFDDANEDSAILRVVHAHPYTQLILLNCGARVPSLEVSCFLKALVEVTVLAVEVVFSVWLVFEFESVLNMVLRHDVWQLLGRLHQPRRERLERRGPHAAGNSNPRTA